MRIEAFRQEGFQLLNEGTIALAQVEENGIRIDMKKLATTKESLRVKIKDLQDTCQGDDVWKLWRKRFGTSANITSRDQLVAIVHGEMGYEITDTTESGEAATDEEALSKIDLPFIRLLGRMLKYKKALGTYLKGIEEEVVDGYIHPSFNLNLARSFRSSCESPNFQNMPVRDKEIAEIIRSLIIASDDGVLGENDFKGIEVALAASYHHDPVFIDYITTPGKDMHRDMAAQLYCVKPAEVSKDMRYGAKNKFVFPQFYGDFYIPCTRALWDWIDKGKLKGPDGKPLKEHLYRQGITVMGYCDMTLEPLADSFEAHVKSVEKDFWERRFRVYGQWRKDTYREYLKNGFFDIKTGFRVFGSYAKNAVTNYPVQGAAFHCLLWCLIQINKALNKYRMKTRIGGQIHDSLVSDIKTRELTDYWEIVEQITTIDLPKHWPWLEVTPEIEYELSLPGGNWYQKKEVKFSKGRFAHPSMPGKSTTDPFLFLEALSDLSKN